MLKFLKKKKNREDLQHELQKDLKVEVEGDLSVEPFKFDLFNLKSSNPNIAVIGENGIEKSLFLQKLINEEVDSVTSLVFVDTSRAPAYEEFSSSFEGGATIVTAKGLTVNPFDLVSEFDCSVKNVSLFLKCFSSSLDIKWTRMHTAYCEPMIQQTIEAVKEKENRTPTLSDLFTVYLKYQHQINTELNNTLSNANESTSLTIVPGKSIETEDEKNSDSELKEQLTNSLVGSDIGELLRLFISDTTSLKDAFNGPTNLPVLDTALTIFNVDAIVETCSGIYVALATRFYEQQQREMVRPYLEGEVSNTPYRKLALYYEIHESSYVDDLFVYHFEQCLRRGRVVNLSFRLLPPIQLLEKSFGERRLLENCSNIYIQRLPNSMQETVETYFDFPKNITLDIFNYLEPGEGFLLQGGRCIALDADLLPRYTSVLESIDDRY